MPEPTAETTRAAETHEKEIRDRRKQSLNHTSWECNYYVVFIPRCRWKRPQNEPRHGRRYFVGRQSAVPEFMYQLK